MSTDCDQSSRHLANLDLQARRLEKQSLKRLAGTSWQPASHQEYQSGRQFAVVKDGAQIRGMIPVGPGIMQGFAWPLKRGTILECAGSGWTMGDGVPIIKWRLPGGQFICQDAEFHPHVGTSLWDTFPDADFLRPLDLMAATAAA